MVNPDSWTGTTQSISDQVPEIKEMSDYQKKFLYLTTTANVVGFAGEPFFEDIFDESDEKISEEEIPSIIEGLLKGEYQSKVNENGIEEIIIDNDKKLFKPKNPIQTIIAEYSNSILNPETSLCILSYCDENNREVKTVTNQNLGPNTFDINCNLIPLAASRIEFLKQNKTKERMEEELLPYLEQSDVNNILNDIEDEGLTLYLAEMINNNQELTKGFFFDLIKITLDKLNYQRDNEEIPKQLIYYTREGSSMINSRYGKDPMFVTLKKVYPNHNINEKLIEIKDKQPELPTHYVKIFKLIKKEE